MLIFVSLMFIVTGFLLQKSLEAVDNKSSQEYNC